MSGKEKEKTLRFRPATMTISGAGTCAARPLTLTKNPAQQPQHRSEEGGGGVGGGGEESKFEISEWVGGGEGGGSLNPFNVTQNP